MRAGGEENDVITMSKRCAKVILSFCRQRTVHKTGSLEQEPSKSDARSYEQGPAHAQNRSLRHAGRILTVTQIMILMRAEDGKQLCK